jgi:hypothetical protein
MCKQWSVVSGQLDLATEAGFCISGCDQLNDKKASSFGWGPLFGQLNYLRRNRHLGSLNCLSRLAADHCGKAKGRSCR